MKNFIKHLLGIHIHSDKYENFFLITSHGQTASMWLAGVLSRIPEVFCTHGYSYPPQAAHLEELSSDEWALRRGSAERFNTLPLSTLHAELKSATNKPIIGNVLAFYLGRLFSRAGAVHRRGVTVVNIVRHPVTRLTSTLKTWNISPDFAPPFVELDFNTRCDHLKNFIMKSHKKVDFSTSDKTFVVSLLAMEDISNDIKLANWHQIQNVKYEEMTTNKEVFSNLVKKVTSNQVNLSQDFLDNLFSSKRINPHNNTGITEADLQYQSWDKWKQDTFKFTLERKGKFKLYENLNYDLSFIK